MRLIAAVFLPPALAFAITYAATRVLDAPQPKPERVTSIVWGNRVFESKRELARWLRARGVNYQTWARRHPAALGRNVPAANSQLEKAHEADSGGSASESATLLFAVAAGVFLLGGLFVSAHSRVLVMVRGPRPARRRASSMRGPPQLPRTRRPTRISRPGAGIGPVVPAGTRIFHRVGGTAWSSCSRVLRAARVACHEQLALWWYIAGGVLSAAIGILVATRI